MSRCSTCSADAGAAPPLSRARRALAALLLLAAFAALYVLANRTVLGQTIEDSWARTYDVRHIPGYLLDEAHLPPFGFDRATIAVGVLAAVAIALVARRWRAALVVTVAAPVAIASGQVFKELFGRPRLIRTLDYDVSYPSGHAGIALAVTAALLVALPRRALRWVAPPLLAWCLLVAGGLQAEGQHRASEVVGSGLLIAAVLLLVGAAVGAAAPAIRVREVRRSPARVPVGTALLVVAVVGAWCPVPWMTAVYAAAALLATAPVAAAALTSRPEPAAAS